MYVWTRCRASSSNPGLVIVKDITRTDISVTIDVSNRDGLNRWACGSSRDRSRLDRWSGSKLDRGCESRLGRRWRLAPLPSGWDRSGRWRWSFVRRSRSSTRALTTLWSLGWSICFSYSGWISAGRHQCGAHYVCKTAKIYSVEQTSFQTQAASGKTPPYIPPLLSSKPVVSCPDKARRCATREGEQGQLIAPEWLVEAGTMREHQTTCKATTRGEGSSAAARG
ncbi:hypothetical protein B0H19DRAFT_1112955 [Mycena capillaripes]|nr:hypothetical protein B0H19DRAFT_1112955 [Mycena capillaripes]